MIEFHAGTSLEQAYGEVGDGAKAHRTEIDPAGLSPRRR
jgi:hypothetical protein